jgi:hypothetical protein
MNFRRCKGTQTLWQDTDGSFSNFDFVDRHYGSDPILRRVFSLARKLGYQSVLVEEISSADCSLMAEEDEALAVRCPDFRGSVVTRFVFLPQLKSVKPQPEIALGYAVFKKDQFGPEYVGHLYEAVLRPPRRQQENNFIHCSQRYDILTSEGTFKTEGVLYAQQNDRTCVCAHVALRSALSCMLPEADVTYARMNQLCGVDHRTRRVGEQHGGLGVDDIENILAGLEVPFGKIVNEPGDEAPLPVDFEYQRDLYGYLESGCPVLLGFELDQVAGEDPLADSKSRRHLIPVIGHTLNEDAWVPPAQRMYFAHDSGYYPSENWLSSYVIHDDNVGPYYCLPRHYLKRDNFRLVLGLKRRATPTSAVDAEALAFSFATTISRDMGMSGESWFDRFVAFSNCGLLALRTVLVRKDEYLGHLFLVRDREGNLVETEVQASVRELLPDWCWVVEISAPELFASSRRKFGEVLLSLEDVPAFLMARLPGHFVLRQSTGELAVGKTQLRGHTDLFLFPRPC